MSVLRCVDNDNLKSSALKPVGLRAGLGGGEGGEASGENKGVWG